MKKSKVVGLFPRRWFCIQLTAHIKLSGKEEMSIRYNIPWEEI
jgi:hypothetical protein